MRAPTVASASRSISSTRRPLATRLASLLASPVSEVERVFATNVFGALRVAKAFSPVLGRNGGGALVDVASVLSWLGIAGAYSASKAALWSLTNSLRLELAPQGTQVVGAHLGYTDTPMIAGLDVEKNDPADVVAAIWDAVEAGDLSKIDREIDWAIKYRLVEQYRSKHNIDLSNPRVAQLDLAYHDIRRGRGVFDLLQRKGLVERVTDDAEIEAAKDIPPQTTRAKLRGDFIAAAQQAGRDFTVDWVHLKLNDQAQRTVLCKDPFRAVDERVERLINSL